MKDTFTTEEIKAAIVAVHVYPDWGGDDIDEYVGNLIDELTKPAIEFKEGEVFVFKKSNGDYEYRSYWEKMEGKIKMGLCKDSRKLTSLESGAGELVEALELLRSASRLEKEDWDDVFIRMTRRAAAAIAKWKDKRGE